MNKWICGGGGDRIGFDSPSSSGDLPFLFTAKKDEWLRFEVNTDFVVESKTEDKDWSCYLAPMRTIRQNGSPLAEDSIRRDLPDGKVEWDNMHEIPFWAMQEFFRVAGHLDGWQGIRAKVVLVNGLNKAVFQRD